MKKLSFCLFALLFPLGNVLGQDAFRIWDNSYGCSYRRESSEAFFRQDDCFASPSRSIPVEAVERVFRAAMEGPRDPSALFAQFEVLRDFIERNHLDLFDRSAPKPWLHSLELKALRDRAHEIVHPEAVIEMLVQSLSQDWLISNAWIDFGVEFSGDHPVTIRAYKYGNHQWGMMPWTVSDGRETWNVYSLELIAAMFEIANPAGPNRESLDWSRFTRLDERAWPVDRIEDATDRRLSLSAIATIPGFREIEERFRIEYASLWRPPHDQLREFRVRLSSKNPEMIEELEVWLESGNPERDWSWVSTRWSQTLQNLERFTWVRQWKEGSDRKTIRLQLESENPLWGIGDAERALRAWTFAELPGQPQFGVTLWNGIGRDWGHLACDLVFSAETGRALIPKAYPLYGDHWLDRIESEWGQSRFWGSNPDEFGVVDEAGNLTRWILPDEKK